jgi:hypothetical protein
MPNEYVEIARNVLKNTNILTPQDANLIVTGFYGPIDRKVNDHILPSTSIELSFRCRQDKKPEIMYNESPPELTRYIKGQSVNPILLPEWVMPGQKFKGSLNNYLGYLIIFNFSRNPHGIHDLIGDKFNGVFVLNSP